MTEPEWLAADNAEPLLRFIEPRASDRKLHLFEVACARRIMPLLLDEMSAYAVEVVERFADGQCGADVFKELDWEVEGAAFSAEYGYAQWLDAVEQLPQEYLVELVANPKHPVRSARELVTSAAYFVDAMFGPIPSERQRRSWALDETATCFQPVFLVHELFGSPFRRVSFRAAWRTDTVLALARQMYESRDFAAMPILADALQDAGCDSADILDHCRGPGPHVRGCWVVDRVLCKK